MSTAHALLRLLSSESGTSETKPGAAEMSAFGDGPDVPEALR